MKSYLFSLIMFLLLSLITPVTFALTSAIPDRLSKAMHGQTESLVSMHPKPTLKKLPLIKRHLIQFNVKARKANAGLIVLVVIGATLVTFLFAFFIFALAYGGASSALVIMTSILGFGLIIFGVVKIIRSIKRKYRTTLLKRHQSRMVINRTAVISK